MIIGIDFDNTIACYDGIFHREAVARNLIPPTVATNKNAVRDFLRQAGMKQQWTELQGHVYGVALKIALPYPGVVECLAEFHRRGFQVRIISHKTKQPVLGPAHDLHRAATDWLLANDIVNATGNGLRPQDVFFENTKHDKLNRIAALGCDLFIDDLPEFLAENDFPQHVRRILFDPENATGDDVRWQRAGCWNDISKLIDG